MGSHFPVPARLGWLALAAALGGSFDARADSDEARDLTWKFGGQVQADHRASDGDGSFLWRRIRPSLELRWGQVLAFKVVPELTGGDFRLTDAYLDVALHPLATLRAGKARTPFGLERFQSSSTLAMNERGFPSELSPSRDLGLQLHGALAASRLEYGIGVFNGGVDGRDGRSANPDDAFDVAARVFFQPWKGDGGALEGLALGLSATSGDRQGAGNEVLPRYRTPGQATFFRYRASTQADGRQTRWSPQIAWVGGPIGVQGEYVSSRLHLRDIASGTRAAVDHHAWQVLGRWVLTGEDLDHRGAVKPARPFSPGKGHWGAFEATARLGRLDIDDDAFPLFADLDADGMATSASAWGMGLNWYPTRHLKLAANYTQASFGHPGIGADLPAAGREDEKTFFTRVQLTF